ncbi:hypothetical protein HPB47_015722 [Ixodes persulcatus]|uniref:Uncharacterized protein n=1 Tax=Ixodes persulcatus TaxID=34615 RepID=A0AC60QWA9_IXOPE|nr:hypothetical protein HPB47_015722 [Ixodes persulcatus]
MSYLWSIRARLCRALACSRPRFRDDCRTCLLYRVGYHRRIRGWHAPCQMQLCLHLVDLALQMRDFHRE